jgi:hypothetical protein
MIWRKLVEKPPVTGCVGTPPFQETVITWLMRFLVWLTVTWRFANSFLPGRVIAESGGPPSAEASPAPDRALATAADIIIASSAAEITCNRPTAIEPPTTST